MLQQAVVRRRRVRLEYLDRLRNQSSRLVDPWGLVDKDDVWYVVAGTEEGQRTFRADRIVDAAVTDEPAERPVDFELAAAWGAVVHEVERRRSLLSATVLLPARLVPVLRDRFGRHSEVVETLDDGRARVRVAAPTPLMIARPSRAGARPCRWRGHREVRAELVRLGRELVHGNSDRHA